MVYRVAQQKQNRFVGCKISTSIYSVAESLFLRLIHVGQSLAEVKNMPFILQLFFWQFVEMFLWQWCFKELSVLLPFLPASEHDANLLNSCSLTFFKQYENKRFHLSILVDDREEILFQESSLGIESCTETCHGDNSLSYRVLWFNGETVGM